MSRHALIIAAVNRELGDVMKTPVGGARDSWSQAFMGPH
jgi:hypothetical protein